MASTEPNLQDSAIRVRVINHQQEDLGVFPLRNAYWIADEFALELVVICSAATPPIYRLMNFEQRRQEIIHLVGADKIARNPMTLEALLKLAEAKGKFPLEVQAETHPSLWCLKDPDRVKLRVPKRAYQGPPVPADLPYRDSSLPYSERALNLLSHMTLWEKVAQMRENAVPKMLDACLNTVVEPGEFKIHVGGSSVALHTIKLQVVAAG